MPLIVDLDDTSVVTATSDDGILTGTVDPDHAGVRFLVDYTQADNVVNGDFEASAAGWAPGGAAPPTLEWSNSGSLSGAGALIIHWGAAAGDVIGQLVDLTIGAAYRVTAWAYKGGHSGDPGPQVQLGTTGATAATQGGDHNRWEQLTLLFTAAATSQALTLATVGAPSGSGQSTKGGFSWSAQHRVDWSGLRVVLGGLLWGFSS